MELFKIGFVPVRLLDLVDIAIVTYLFYKLWNLLRGGIALRILGAILLVFLFYKLFDLLELVLLKTILDQFIGVGMIFLIIIFAPEIRRFLIVLGKNTIIDRLLSDDQTQFKETTGMISELVNGVEKIRKGKYGALIVLAGANPLEDIQETGDRLNSDISERLLESIFLPDSPLHDGAVIIANSRVAAARCVLPLSNNAKLPPELGLRHRAGLGVTELTGAMVIVVSEERNEISVGFNGKLNRDIDLMDLEARIHEFYRTVQEVKPVVEVLSPS